MWCKTHNNILTQEKKIRRKNKENRNEKISQVSIS